MNNAQLLISIQVDAGVAANLVRDLIQEAKLTGRVALGAGDIAVLRAASGRLTSATAAMVELCSRIPATPPKNESDSQSESV